uniref:Uncharacterized protein n=1 Tax=Octopus bimaculoides TaxID=37653 RepID=A0A0L8G527_OCTBM
MSLQTGNSLHCLKQGTQFQKHNSCMLNKYILNSNTIWCIMPTNYLSMRYTSVCCKYPMIWLTQMQLKPKQHMRGVIRLQPCIMQNNWYKQ